MRILLSAPYVGEFGWELMSWQGRVRLHFQQGRYDRLIVLGSSGKSALYADMPTTYQEVDLSTVPGVAYEDSRILPQTNELLPAPAIRAALEPLVEQAAVELRVLRNEVDTLWPDYSETIYPCEPTYQSFIKFERPCNEMVSAPWVVFVQRNRSFGASNWEPDQWSTLRQLLENHGVHTSVYPQTADAAIAVATHCDLAVGQSTGGLHLASLCGCPHVAWSPGGQRVWTRWEITNRQRYETFWNPHGTPVRFHDISRQPDPAEVADWTLRALPVIGRRTGSVQGKAAFRARWHLKNWLVRRIVQRQSFRRWPWPAQQFVRYQLI